MFGLGTGELLLLLFIALVVLGPERLPGLARDIGKTMQDLRRTSDELTGEFMRADADSRATTPSDAQRSVEPEARPLASAPAVEAQETTQPEVSPEHSEVEGKAAVDDMAASDRDAQRAADEVERERREPRKDVPPGWKVPEDLPEPDRFG